MIKWERLSEGDVPDPTPRQAIAGWTLAIVIGLSLWALMI